jgi:two-component system phosphate regulon response regulator OmpR
MRAELPSEIRGDLPDHAPHVLVVDDDRRLRELLSRFLNKNGYRVTTAASAAEARAKTESVVFDALVLDVMMPGESGFDYMRGVRRHSDVPILMLTAQADASDRIKGLEIGADDYLPKPFDTRELILRLGNILKRQTAPAEPAPRPARDHVRFGPFTFRFDRGELRRDDEPIRITEREREILTILGHRAGDDVSREELAGGGNDRGNERTVDVQMNRLRRKIELDPANPLLLQTVRGIGYRLVVDP